MAKNTRFKVGDKVRLVPDPKTGTIHDEFDKIKFYQGDLPEEGGMKVMHVYKENYLPDTVEVFIESEHRCVDIHADCLELVQ